MEVWLKDHSRIQNLGCLIKKYLFKTIGLGRCDMYIYIYTIKNNEIMPFGATWMDLEVFMLSKKNQTGKNKSYVILLYVESKRQNR